MCTRLSAFLILATMVALVSLSEAKPRQRPAVPPSPHLTELERLCQTLGTMAYQAVVMRDAGASYLQLLAIYREQIAQRPATSYLQASIDASILDNLRMVYDTPYITPAGNRQATERICLRTLEQYVQAEHGQSTKDRY